MELPLSGIRVLEFSQYLAGPSAGLRLADFGAEVIKIERPGKGEAGRGLAIENLWVDENTTLLFHTINRNKKSIEVNLKDEEDKEILKKLIKTSDVMTQNFRPGVMQSLGLDYDAIKKISPGIIYVSISGYGDKGPWKMKPGQDLLAQALSGLTYTTGNNDQLPTPFGVSIGDYFSGNQAVQGILAALIRRQKTGKGALIELSLVESLIDFQFEAFTTYFKSKKQPKRAAISNGHPLLGAPYGMYKTLDGYIAVAMMPLERLNLLLQSDNLLKLYTDDDIFSKRDEIKKIIAEYLSKKPTTYWMKLAREHDLWIIPVLDWKELRTSDTYQALQLEQEINTSNGKSVTTVRTPIRINKKRFVSNVAAPRLGQDNDILKSI